MQQWSIGSRVWTMLRGQHSNIDSQQPASRATTRNPHESSLLLARSELVVRIGPDRSAIRTNIGQRYFVLQLQTNYLWQHTGYASSNQRLLVLSLESIAKLECSIAFPTPRSHKLWALDVAHCRYPNLRIRMSDGDQANVVRLSPDYSCRRTWSGRTGETGDGHATMVKWITPADRQLCSRRSRTVSGRGGQVVGKAAPIAAELRASIPLFSAWTGRELSRLVRGRGARRSGSTFSAMGSLKSGETRCAVRCSAPARRSWGAGGGACPSALLRARCRAQRDGARTWARRVRRGARGEIGSPRTDGSSADRPSNVLEILMEFSQASARAT